MSDLTTSQRKALEALLTCATVRDAAKQAELCERTLYRYLADEDFKAQLRALQDQTINAATAALAGAAGEAIGVLREILTDEEATQATRVRAAIAVLDQVQRLTTFADLEARIAALEAQQWQRA